jgi:outer membrane receptor protein involved in Fe transport
MAGLVNIITKKPEKGFHLKLNASAGSFNFINLSPVVSYADDKLNILVGYSYSILNLTKMAMEEGYRVCQLQTRVYKLKSL